VVVEEKNAYQKIGSITPPPPFTDEGDQMMVMQAEIDDLYAKGDALAGAALLAKYTDTYLRERRPSAQPPPPPIQRDICIKKRDPRLLIMEDMSEASSVRSTRDIQAPPALKRPRIVSPVNQPGEKTQTNGQSEAERAKAMTESGKGRMTLANGDVIENGRLILLDDSQEMDKSLPPLSPVMTVWMKTFKAYIPLTAFNKLFLVYDQQAWGTKDPQTEAKVLKGGPGIRVFSGESPPDKLLMQFEQWLDCMKLFIRYVKDAGWWTMSERFKAHMEVVMVLRDEIGRMVALRYCRRVRQGLMRQTVDNKICNISKVQSVILEEVKQTCENFGERSYQVTLRQNTNLLWGLENFFNI
jgi:hypothetical protein